MKFSKEISYKLYDQGREKPLEYFTSTQRINELSYQLEFDGVKSSGQTTCGNYCVWLPIDKSRGVKIITLKDAHKYNEGNLTVSSVLENIAYIKEVAGSPVECNDYSPVFPKIYSFGTIGEYIVVEMERVYEIKGSRVSKKHSKWLPQKDMEFANKYLENNLDDLTKCVKEITRLRLLPDDEWFKSKNLIGGKIVDFHFFSKMEDRYLMPSSFTKEETEEIYKGAVKRYLSRGDNKFKGKIYQGFQFKNGYDMVGYSSDKQYYDSYLKLPFCFMRKTRDKHVLDLGTNEGFFSIESYLHGAKTVTGIDLIPEDIALANEIKKIVGAKSVTYLLEDAVKFMKDTKTQYDVIIMNSVLHQIYKNMEGSDKFLNHVAAKTKYFVYETPVNHPLMRISLEDIYNKLKKHFVLVKLLYLYDAYSSGYRANFVCYTFG